MLFNSLQFLFFFVIVCSIYYLLPLYARWIWLLLASCYFYAVLNPYYLLILAAAITIDYICGIALFKTEDGKWRKVILAFSILSNLSILAYFKYHNFFIDNLHALTQSLGHPMQFNYLSLALPIGLSFHTFQSMSYCVEVYRKRQVAERNPFVFALYVMFFPQLVAGPIERPHHLLHQLRSHKSFFSENVKSGLILMAWGLFKKVVISDRISMYVNQVYAGSEHYSSAGLFVAVIFFSFQIYCDFSGYSDMARGAARVMGYDLMVNFNTPYFSSSIKEFWTRWHISLSSWFRDYVYIPLGGSKVSGNRYIVNILIVFLLSGFWHGANWTFVVWGLLYGVFLLLTVYFGSSIKRFNMPSYLSVCFTFLFVSLAWVFFRSASIHSANSFLLDLFSFQKGLFANEYFSLNHIFFSFGLIILLLLLEAKCIKWLLSTDHFYPKALAITLVIYFLGVFSQAQFIYFQF